jgi:hypothetical protein
MKMPSFSHSSLVLGLLLTLSLSSESFARGGSFSGSREGARGGSVSVEGAKYGRFGGGSVEATGPRGGTYEASGARAGRYGAGTRSATGPNGGTYEASGARGPRYATGSVDATGPNGGTYNASATRYTGYRSGYVYTGGVYRPATVNVNSIYVAPVGAYAGYKVWAQPYYISYPVYATYPVETSVQVELKRRGYYKGDIDGQMGPGTSKAISKYQGASGLQVTGSVNQALLVSLGIVKA